MCPEENVPDFGAMSPFEYPLPSLVALSCGYGTSYSQVMTDAFTGWTYSSAVGKFANGKCVRRIKPHCCIVLVCSLGDVYSPDQ